MQKNVSVAQRLYTNQVMNALLAGRCSRYVAAAAVLKRETGRQRKRSISVLCTK